MEEKIIWKGSPSQLSNLGTYVLCVLFCWLVIPVFIGIWKWIETSCMSYEITDKRIISKHGVLSRTTDELEFFRVKDIQQKEPFLLRLFSLSNIVIISSDRTHSSYNIKQEENNAALGGLTIEAVPDGAKLRSVIRNSVYEHLNRPNINQSIRE